jgi:ferric enterobactin receptor
MLALVLLLSFLGGVKGTVADKDSKQPVPYATIVITDPASGKTINGAVATDKGTFQIKDLPAGKYSLTVDFIGYNKQVIPVTITNSTQDIGIIYISPTSKSLNEVVVTSKAPTIENKVDRVVYNVATDITSQGGVAIDVLKKVPQVTVDVDGNVELQGSSSIRFLINGKPSAMFGNSLSDALASIPASQIKSIEAITSPGAMYDGQGTGGIINIVLKDNRTQGVNGNVALGIGTRLENGSVNFNVRNGDFGMNVFFNGNQQLSSRTPSTRNRYAFDTQTELLQQTTTDFTRKAYQTGMGLEYKDFNATIGYSYFGNRSAGNTYQDSTITYADTRNHTGSVDWSLGYHHKALSVLYSGSSGNPYIDYVQSRFITGEATPFAGALSNTPGQDVQHNISADYDISKVFTGGVKAIFHKLSNPANAYALAGKDYLPDSTQSYQFDYRMNIYAAYLSSKFKLLNYFDVVAGMRYEYTAINMQYQGKSIPSYGQLLPSVNIVHQLKEGKSIKFAYTRRLERPDKELNPFVNISDPYNITTGNPYLKPEIGNNFELGYTMPVRKEGTLYIALVERHNSDDLKPYTQYFDTYQVGDSLYHGVSVTNRANIGNEYNSGLLITGSLPLTRHLNIRENLMVFDRYVVTHIADAASANGINWRLNLNAAYTFPKDLSAEVFGEYRSPINSIQGRIPQSVNYTIAVRKAFLHKNATLGITATNPFNEYINQTTTITTTNYTSTYLRKLPYRSFGISMTYKFGKLQFKKDKETEDFLNSPPAN